MEELTVQGPALLLSAKASEDAMIVRLVGELDLAGADAMRRLAGWVEAHPPGLPLVLDLSDLTFVDSSGIRMLLETSTSVEPVALFAPSPPVARVLDIIGLRDRFGVVDNLDSATLNRLRDEHR